MTSPSSDDADPLAPLPGFLVAQRTWFDRLAARPPRLLLVQRDNIGDLVLVTPFLQALRACLQDATIDILVNSYNEAVIARNPHLTRSYTYVKAKHRSPAQSLAAVYWNTWKLWRTLRANQYDLAILMTGRFARNSLRPALAAHIPLVAGFVDASAEASRIDLGIAPDSIRERHVVRRTEALLDAVVPASLRQRFWPGELPPCEVFPDADRVRRISRERELVLGARQRRVVGIHMSARKADQRLSVAKFVSVMHQLHARTDCAFMLFWAPGGQQNRQHPGDDLKAEELLALTTGLPVFAHKTADLPDLIAGLGLVDLLLCSDGGAMHLAAAQRIPIVAMFGNSDPDMWFPWATRYEVLRPDTHRVDDLEVDAILAALSGLLYAPSGPLVGEFKRA
ncbi:MAG: glycosyltransferase family 9 protein [Burkholderiaceae bacterium]